LTEDFLINIGCKFQAVAEENPWRLMAYIFVALAYQFCGSLWLSMFRGGSQQRNNGSMYSSIDDD